MSTEAEQQLKERLVFLESELQKKAVTLAQKNRLIEVEAALEKVRARTLNMRNSAELSETSAVLFHELHALGIHAIRTGVGIFDDANEAMELWLTTVSDSQEVSRILDYFSLHIHPVFENIIPARQQNKPYTLTILRGNEVRQYYQMMSTYLSQPVHQQYHPEEFFYSFFFPQGTLNVVAAQPLTEEECSVMIRFAHVFGLIYTRFQDLQIAEAQTREALQKASLDRVRAEITSMRAADDLQHVTPLIWRELVTLGVPFFRCGIFIVSEPEQLVHAYLSTPEGKSLAVLHLPFDGLDTTQKVVESWKHQNVYTDHWNQNQFQAWVKSMAEQGQIENPQQFQVADEPIKSLHLQFTPFKQGMLYVGSHEPLEENQINLVKSLADAFSVAYARYEDFKQLEDAKNHLEATLAELRATQSQLIQSEKMASLGELTAGIAHEIQNPLNFVNNFSEVNTELIKEIQDERRKTKDERDEKMEGELLNNISENEKKIVHHGKRADAIIKGMLQHSRGSSGVKEPTDINALADEYLRLAYHGLRAKDKSFNAKFETHFDESIGMIEVVPQDIGRVILNLITNAFYAVSEKMKRETADVKGDSSHVSTLPSHYEPTVTVTTKKLSDTIEIRVKDNGNGIPDSIKEKIFQPFFTTKPTGQGTGLGLSLGYDIIKVHGGTLEVNSKEGLGSEFIIHLPV
jgi:signal transduction histidine kinase